MILSISEILELTNKIFKKKDQIDFLRRHDSAPLRGILRCALDPSIEWLLPPGAPPYKPSEALDQEGQLYQRASKLVIFLKGYGYDNLRPAKREALFISLLESVTPGDAELMTFVKDKMINYPDITPALVQEAFPGLLGAIEPKKATMVAEKPTPQPATSGGAPKAPPSKKRKDGPIGISGFKNVKWNKRSKKWTACRSVNGKSFYIGIFDDPRAADMAVEVFCKEHNLER